MFDRTLNSSWDERSRRGLTTLTSFGLQALAVTVLVALPLLRGGEFSPKHFDVFLVSRTDIHLWLVLRDH